MYTATKRPPWESVWYDADSQLTRNFRRRLQRPYRYKNIDWPSVDQRLPKLAILLPAKFNSMEISRTPPIPDQPIAPIEQWWFKVYPHNLIEPRIASPEVQLSNFTQWANVICFGCTILVVILSMLLLIYMKLIDFFGSDGVFECRRRRPGESGRTGSATTRSLDYLGSLNGDNTAISIIPPPDTIIQHEQPPPYATVVNLDPIVELPPPYSECSVTVSNTNKSQARFYVDQNMNCPEEAVKMDIKDTGKGNGVPEKEERGEDQTDDKHFVEVPENTAVLNHA